MECLQWRPKIRESLKFRVLPDGKVVIFPAYGLNETASKVFLLIDGRRTVTEIAELLLSEYDVDYGTLIKDLCELLQLFKDLGFITVDVSQRR